MFYISIKVELYLSSSLHENNLCINSSGTKVESYFKVNVHSNIYLCWSKPCFPDTDLLELYIRKTKLGCYNEY